jgi:pimeloyl-ACP methyl ester carboxylesterase
MDRFRRSGLVFEVCDGGPAGRDAVVLLHGFPQDNSCFDEVVPDLHAAGLRTLAPLQRGYSAGARPPGRARYRLAECAADVLALLDEAGVGAAHVVGHDWGGAVGWHLGQHHAARVRSLVVLSTPHPRAMLAAMVRSGQLARSAYMALFQVPVLPERILPGVLPRALAGSGLPEAAARRYLARLSEPGALTAALNWYRAIPWSASAPAGTVAVPTTYVWGRGDPYLGRAAAERTSRYVTGSYDFHELDAGHWLPETHAATIADLILRAARAH